MGQAEPLLHPVVVAELLDAVPAHVKPEEGPANVIHIRLKKVYGLTLSRKNVFNAGNIVFVCLHFNDTECSRKDRQIQRYLTSINSLFAMKWKDKKASCCVSEYVK